MCSGPAGETHCISSPDVCDPHPSCGVGGQRPAFRDRRAAPTDVDTDIAFILDSSESTTPLQFSEMRKYISHLVSNLEISSEPKHTTVSKREHCRPHTLPAAPPVCRASAQTPALCIPGFDPGLQAAKEGWIIHVLRGSERRKV